MAVVREMIDTIASVRQKAGIKLRWPLSTMTIECPETNETVTTAIHDLETIILAQGNVKSVEVTKKWDKLEKKIEPNYSAIGPAFKAEGKKAAEFITSHDPEDLLEKIETGSAKFNDIPIIMDMVTISEKVPEGFHMGEFSHGRLYLDSRITPELEAEAYGREIIRRVQEMRQEQNLKVEEMISTTLHVTEDLREKIIGWIDHIATETRSEDIRFGEPAGYSKEWDVEDYKVLIGIERTD